MKCGACGAEVRAIPTTSCSRLKLDLEPSADGDVVVGTIAGIDIGVRISETAARKWDGPLYRRHEMSCSRADARHVPGVRRISLGEFSLSTQEVRPSEPSS